jgi:hypothetical protein
MPNAGDNSEPLASVPVLRPKGPSVPRKGRAILLGGVAYAVVRAVGAIVGKTGLTIDPTVLQGLSAIAGGVTFAGASSPTLEFCLRLVSLRMLLFCHLITKPSYIQLRKDVEQAFKNSIKD